MHSNPNLDPMYENERNGGTTAPESAEAGSNVVGRPRDDDETGGFHERSEKDTEERAPFNPAQALDQGASFDGLGVPVADDRP